MSKKAAMLREVFNLALSVRIIPLGAILAILYWFLESVIDSAIFREKGFPEEFLSPRPGELWMRICIVLLILAFFTYAHVMVVKNRRVQERLQASEQMQRALLNATMEGALLLDVEGTITALNDRAAQAFGKGAAELIGENVFGLYGRETGALRRAQGDTVVRTKKPILVEEQREGRFFDISIFPVIDPTGSVVRWAIYSQDITERKQMEQELVRLSITDNLTGLFNQRHFTKKIEEETDRARRMGYPLCLVIFDVDNFKVYNDTYGHLKGDEILKTIGEVTKRSIRRDVDSGFRYGGDEFALILPYADEATATEITERIGKRVTEDTNGVTLSFGISTLSEGVRAYDLIHSADRLMYERKGQDKGIPAPDSDPTGRTT